MGQGWEVHLIVWNHVGTNILSSVISTSGQRGGLMPIEFLIKKYMSSAWGSLSSDSYLTQC